MKNVANSLLSVAFAAALALGANGAQAAINDGVTISHNDVWPLMEWVEARVGQKVPGLPKVTASGTRLKTALGLHGVQQARAMAAYIPGEVILNHIIWDRNSKQSTSYLVHELVHHAQFFSDKKYACDNAKEREAYELQNQWLAEQGEPPAATERFIDEVSACGEPV